jgi:hypothetical protein
VLRASVAAGYLDSSGGQAPSPTPHHRTHMKSIYVVLALPVLSACVSIELPGVVLDATKLAKDTYRSVVGSKGEQEGPAASTDSPNSVSNTYIGQDNQTPVEVKNLCVSEAVAKLFKANGKEVPYTIIENTISTVNNAISANCKVVATKTIQAPQSQKQ